MKDVDKQRWGWREMALCKRKETSIKHITKCIFHTNNTRNSWLMRKNFVNQYTDSTPPTNPREKKELFKMRRLYIFPPEEMA